MQQRIVKSYKGSELRATTAYREDAEGMVSKGYTPISQVWTPGAYGIGAFLIALLLCFVFVGFLVFIYMVIVKPPGTLTVTYAVPDRMAPEKNCPRCAEPVKAAAVVCRFCGHEFDSVGLGPLVAAIPSQNSKKEPSRQFAFWAVIIVGLPLLIGFVSWPSVDLQPSYSMERAAEAARRAKTEAERRDRVVELAERRSDIIGDIEKALRRKDFAGAGRITSNYYISGDPEIRKLHVLAQSGMNETRNRDRVLAIETELKSVPESNLVLNKKLYGQLLELNPSSQLYQSRLKSYSDKLAAVAAQASSNLATTGAAGKTYTPEVLRRMVASGKIPSQGQVSSQSQESTFEACVEKAISVSTAVQPEYPVRVVVNTRILYTVKFWTNDAAVTVSCSGPDKKLIITTAKYN